MDSGQLRVLVIPALSHTPPPPAGAGLAYGGLHYYESGDIPPKCAPPKQAFFSSPRANGRVGIVPPCPNRFEQAGFKPQISLDSTGNADIWDFLQNPPTIVPKPAGRFPGRFAVPGLYRARIGDERARAQNRPSFPPGPPDARPEDDRSSEECGTVPLPPAGKPYRIP